MFFSKIGTSKKVHFVKFEKKVFPSFVHYPNFTIICQFPDKNASITLPLE